MIDLDGYTYEMHEAIQERKMRHKKKCDLCGYPIEDEAYEIEGKLICPECIEEAKTWVDTDEEWDEE